MHKILDLFVSRGGSVRGLAGLWFVAASAAVSHGQTSVLTWHNDNARTGQNLQETVLTPATVASGAFQKLFVIGVDGKVDAQPLYVPSVAIPGQGIHNTLYVMTEHDSAYAFDADTGAQLWHVSLFRSGETPSDDRGCSQVTPEIGITATPIIDPHMGPNGAMYAVAMSKTATGTYHHRLHALDLTSGSELFGGPVEIQASYPGSGAEGSGSMLTFDPAQHKERAALIIVNNVVYTAWSSHCDIPPYTGWVIGYNEGTLAQTSVLNLTPNGSDGGIWAAGSGPAEDSAGNLYLLLGNGTFDTTLNAAGMPVNGDYGNGFVKLSTNGGLAVADYFMMWNTVSESASDLDLGSGGAMVLPTVTDASGQPRMLAVGAGKDQHIYVVDRNNMGKFVPGTNAIYEDLPSALSGGVWSSPAWFNGNLYYGAVGDYLKAFGFAGGTLGANPLSQSPASFAYPGTTPSISANGAANGIVWAAENTDPAVLHAYDATDLSTELYNSNSAANGRDHFGTGNKFIVPTVVNGKVYVATTSGVGVFGIVPPPSVHIDLPASGATVSGTVTVSGWAIDNTATVGTAISSVRVLVDGTAVGTATYGVDRPDVCAAYPGRSGCPNVGYTYSLNTATLAPRSHTLTVTATDSDSSPDTGSDSETFTVTTGAARTIPTVVIDSPVQGATVSGTVTVSGWAIDNDSAGGNRDQQRACVGGRNVGRHGDLRSQPAGCVRGISRPSRLPQRGVHILAEHGNAGGRIAHHHGYGHGFRQPARHRFCQRDSHRRQRCCRDTVRLHRFAGSRCDSLGHRDGRRLGDRQRLGGGNRNQQRAGAGGRNGGGHGELRSQPAGCVRSVSGPARLPQRGVHIFAEHRSADGRAAQHYGYSQGFGQPSRRRFGQSDDSSSAAAPHVIPTVHIDSPAPGATVSGTVTVSGWAIDNDSAVGTAIGSVRVLVDGTSMGTATYGASRPDVCAAYPGRPGCPNVGFTYSLNTATLASGSHTITVTATDSASPPDTGSATITVHK